MCRSLLRLDHVIGYMNHQTSDVLVNVATRIATVAIITIILTRDVYS